MKKDCTFIKSLWINFSKVFQLKNGSEPSSVYFSFDLCVRISLGRVAMWHISVKRIVYNLLASASRLSEYRYS